MTREEAIRLLDLNRESLKNTNTLGFKDDIEALDIALKALEQESILDKIRAEIASKILPFEPDTYNGIVNLGITTALAIIDKYRKEQTDADSD